LHGVVDCFPIRRDSGLSGFLIEYTGRVTPQDPRLGLTSWLQDTSATMELGRPHSIMGGILDKALYREYRGAL